MIRHIRLSCFVLALLTILASTAFAYQQIEFIREIGGSEKKTKERLLSSPRALALSGEKIYIADTDAHRVAVLDMSGKMVFSWGEKGDKSGQFKSPAGIAVDEQGRVYVADTGNGRIQVFDAAGKWLRSIGGKGSGPREFSNPSGITVRRGLLYVADAGNSRVQVLTYDGIFTGQFTVKTKKDEMRAPVAVAVDVRNKVYVLDADGNTVRVFDAAGVQIEKFGSRGKGSGGFNKPQGLAVDNRGNVYVSDMGNFKLKKFDGEGTLLGSLGSEGDGPGQFREAAGIDIDRDGEVFMLDAGKNTLQIFSSEPDDGRQLEPASPLPTVGLVQESPGEVSAIAANKRVWALTNDSIIAVGVRGERTIGSRGSKPALLKNPRGLTLDRAGNFWVADTGNDRLQKFSLQGSLLQVIGQSGSGEGEFRSPSGIAIDSKGTIYVADTGNRRVQVFSSKGMFLGTFGKGGNLRGQFSEPVGLAVDGSDFVYVVDRGNDRIAKYDNKGVLVWETGKTGKQDGEFNAPSDVLVLPEGELCVLDAGNARVQVFDRNGKFLRKFGNEGKGPGEFRSPQGLALESSVRLYVGDRGNSRVQVFSLHYTPAEPRDLAVQTRANQIQLNWKANTEPFLEQYRVYRSDSPTGQFKLIGTPTEPFFIDRNLPSNRAFIYRVTGKAREGNESVASDSVTAMTPKLVPVHPKKVRIEPWEKEVTLSWLPNTEPFVSHYRVYRTKQVKTGFELVARTEKTVFVDSPLADETLYYYQVTAVGKEGDESPPSEVVFASTPKASLTMPPIEISRIEINEIFAAAYKNYESNPLGKLVITNNTDQPYPKAKIRFSIKGFMDYPAEIEIAEIAPKQSMVLELKPVFNNKILDVTENASLQSEINLTYYEAGEPKTVTRSFPVTLYELHAIRWDQKAKIGSFVTANDAVVADFARSVILPYADSYPSLHKSIVYARAIYDALGVLGVSYIVDQTPFQEFSENTAIVDYTQFPRDVLARKSGDCDDLSMMYAASLENIGIETALVGVPGHVFVMFNTGTAENERFMLGFPDDLLVVYQGTAWIPVEMTLVGTSFTRAWQKGAEECRDWSAKGKMDIISVHKAWERFQPVTLSASDIKVSKVKSDDIEAKYKGELQTLAEQRLANLSARLIDTLKKNSRDLNALGQLGLLYSENGLYAEALEQFQKMLAIDKNDAMALNNIGNINYLQGRLDDARLAYEATLKISESEPGVMVNLARVFLQMGKKEEAKQWFQNALALDPRVVRSYNDLAASLGVIK
ncbi:MAG TPA: 6-bladed beta-propeller [Nitrospirota bacterium]|nr:6-bladed beta-propeller [Nitrospirota bacterium]